MATKRIIDQPGGEVTVVTLWKQETLNEITKNSGELAKTNEYQVHYWALNLESNFEDGSKLVIQVPTVIFNYPQKVAPASIDFSLKDVEEASEQLKEWATQEALKAKEAFHKAGYKLENFTATSVSLNTLHRHP